MASKKKSREKAQADKKTQIIEKKVEKTEEIEEITKEKTEENIEKISFNAQLLTALSNLNNILISHKDAEELKDYRRMFYSLFFIFCVLFLLGVFGLYYIQQGYDDKTSQLEQKHRDDIEALEFVLDNKLKQERFELLISNLDLDSDDSITKYVDPKISFNDKGYIPKDLVAVSSEFIKDSKGYIEVHKIAQENLNKLAKQFYDETQQEIIVVSGYRSYAYQKGIKDRGCPDNLCAKAGHSEHQAGYAIDLYSASTQAEWLGSNTLRKHFDWLNANAHVYGFTNPYRKGVEIDGYEPEPWHWRYVGKDLARYLKQHDLTFAEFYYARKILK